LVAVAVSSIGHSDFFSRLLEGFRAIRSLRRGIVGSNRPDFDAFVAEAERSVPPGDPAAADESV
jgi:hypothetical protein